MNLTYKPVIFFGIALSISLLISLSLFHFGILSLIVSKIVFVIVAFVIHVYTAYLQICEIREVI